MEHGGGDSGMFGSANPNTSPFSRVCFEYVLVFTEVTKQQ